MGGAITAFDALAAEIADVAVYSLAVFFEVAEADFLTDCFEGGVLGCLVGEGVDLGG